MTGYHFTIQLDRAGEYRARFKRNSEVIFSTEGFTTKAGALHAIAEVKVYAPDAQVDDQTEST